MLTSTTPSRANYRPSYCVIAPVPLAHAPPWIHTITGSPVAVGSGVQMFKLRHSSPAITGSGRIASNGGKYGGLGTVAPKASASRTPSQDGEGRRGAAPVGAHW